MCCCTNVLLPRVIKSHFLYFNNQFTFGAKNVFICSVWSMGNLMTEEIYSISNNLHHHTLASQQNMPCFHIAISSISCTEAASLNRNLCKWLQEISAFYGQIGLLYVLSPLKKKTVLKLIQLHAIFYSSRMPCRVSGSGLPACNCVTRIFHCLILIAFFSTNHFAVDPFMLLLITVCST